MFRDAYELYMNDPSFHALIDKALRKLNRYNDREFRSLMIWGAFCHLPPHLRSDDGSTAMTSERLSHTLQFLNSFKATLDLSRTSIGVMH